jgi:oxygen-independent coproporphyrinogen-3 oxidase
MLNALRLNDGFDAALFAQRTGLGMDRIAGPLAEARARGLLEPEPQRIRPSTLGRRFLNDLTALFLPT